MGVSQKIWAQELGDKVWASIAISNLLPVLWNPTVWKIKKDDWLFVLPLRSSIGSKFEIIFFF
jgi:hypothetical protein